MIRTQQVEFAGERMHKLHIVSSFLRLKKNELKLISYLTLYIVLISLDDILEIQ